MALTLVTLLTVTVAALGVLSGAGVLGGQGNEQRQRTEAEHQARRHGPLALPPVPSPKAGTRDCATVLGALPPDLLIGHDHVPRREVAPPKPPATIAWGDTKHDPVTVRCGIEAPAELTPTSQLVDVSGVEWLELSEGDTSSWVVADRPVFVALTVPKNAGSGPVQDLSAILGRTLPKQDVFP